MYLPIFNYLNIMKVTGGEFYTTWKARTKKIDRFESKNKIADRTGGSIRATVAADETEADAHADGGDDSDENIESDIATEVEVKRCIDYIFYAPHRYTNPLIELGHTFFWIPIFLCTNLIIMSNVSYRAGRCICPPPTTALKATAATRLWTISTLPSSSTRWFLSRESAG